MTVDGCYACGAEARAGDLPVREETWVESGWRLAHSFGGSLPGWFVLVTRRHVTSLDELTSQEAAALGPLLVRVSAALRDVLGCTKTYTAFFAEAEGFAHLHIHLVPRMPDQPADRRGPAVFAHLAEDTIPEADRDRVAAAVRHHLAAT